MHGTWTVDLADIPYDPIADKPLPGIAPCPLDMWLYPARDYAAQMQERSTILSHHRDTVLYYGDNTHDICLELYDHVCTTLSAHRDFTVTDAHVICPDGRKVLRNPDTPLETLNAIVQEDFCIMVKHGDEYVLRAALLCFPAAWSLAEKIEKPLTAIHKPVTQYESRLAARVARLFDGIRAGRPLWRDNRLYYNDPDLFYLATEANPRPPAGDDPRYLRSERQVLYRLPNSNAVVFALRTFLVDLHAL